MSDIVSFVLQLKDLMSGGIQKVAATTHAAFGGINETIEGTQRYLDKLGEAAKIRVDTSELEEAHGRVREFTSAWEVMRGTMAGELAIQGIERGIEFGKDFLKESIMGGLEESRIKTQLNVMDGQIGGTERYEAIKENLLSSMYGPQLFDIGKGLTAVGLGKDEMIKRISEFEDIAGADAGNMQQLFQTYMEFKGEGHVASQRMLMPLEEMGFDPGKVLADHYHINQQQAKKLLSVPGKGFGYYEQALDLITGPGGKMHDMQKRLMDEPVGKVALAETNWEHTKHEFGEKLMPILGDMLDKFKPLMDKLPALLEKGIPILEAVGNKMISLVSWIENNTSTIKDLITWTKRLVEVYIVSQGIGLVRNVAGAFMEGLTGEVAGSGMGIAGMMGLGAGGLETATGIAVTGALGAVGGVAAIALIAYEIYSHKQPFKSDILPENAHTEDLQKAAGGEAIGWNYQPILASQPVSITAAMNKKYGPAHMPKEHTPGTNEDLKGSSDAIIGGGKKVINVNVKSFAEHFVVNAGNLKDAAAEVKSTFERMFLEVLQSANAAM